MVYDSIIFPIGISTTIAIFSGILWSDDCLSRNHGKIRKICFGNRKRSLCTSQLIILLGTLVSILLNSTMPIFSMFLFIGFEIMFWLFAPIFLNFKIGNRYFVNTYWKIARVIVDWIGPKNVKESFLRQVVSCLVKSRDSGNVASTRVIQYLIDCEELRSQVEKILLEIGGSNQ